MSAAQFPDNIETVVSWASVFVTVTRTCVTTGPQSLAPLLRARGCVGLASDAGASG